MEALQDLSQFTLNLRWIISQKVSASSEWGRALERLSRTTVGSSRALGLLWGAEPKAQEVEMIKDLTGYEHEELFSVPLYGRNESVRRLNFQYLLDAMPKGASQLAAKQIGITPSQLSRWRKGVEKPRASNVRKLLRFHGIDPDTDLDKVPLFLAMEPVSGYQQKKWVADRLMEMPADQMAAIYPALKKMLRTDEDH
jgi:transcriptional regulator with XRE-family HTH domain